MKTHTSEFKEKIKQFGRELDSKITYTINGVTTELGNEQLNSVSPHYEGAILKSVMKQLDIDSNVEIPVGTELNYQLGVKTRSGKNIFDGEIEQGSIQSSNGQNTSATNRVRTINYIDVDSSTQYTINATTSLAKTIQTYIFEYQDDTTFIQRIPSAWANLSYTFTTSANAKKIRIIFAYSDGTTTNVSEFSNMQLELGNQATSYEAYPYDYVNYGNYIVKEVEKQEDTRSYKITCYDKMLYSMTEYKRIIGKNLFNPTEFTTKQNVSCSADGTITSTAIGTGAWQYSNSQINTTLNAGTYKITIFFDTQETSSSGGIRVYNSNNTELALKNNLSSLSSYTLTITLNSTTNIGIMMKLSSVAVAKLQIEKGNTATSYRPYFKYPTTIRNYIDAICYDLGIDFANYNDNFANYDKQISSELYLSYDNETDTYSSLNYTFRDVLDELAQVTASTICINEETDKLEIRYINQTIGKNLFDKNGNFGGSNTVSVLDTGVKITQTSAGQYKYNSIVIGKDELLGKKVTITSNMSASASNTPALRLYFGSSSSTTSSHIGSLYSTGNTTITIPSSFPTNTDRIYLLVYSNRDGTGNINDYCEYTNLQIELGEEATSYEPYGDTIDEEYLKDVNVNFGEMFGAVNTIVLSRSADADNIYYPSTLPSNPIEIKIADNQIMNGNDRDTYMQDIYNKLNGLYYYINDYSSTGICYYNLCDRYNVKIGDEFYSCIMLNDTANITQGLEEQIYVDMPEETNTDYTKADSTDRKINTAYIIANKAEASIQEVTRQLDNVNGTLDEVITTQDATSRTISIISTNIDPTTGEVNEVTTKEKRFTLNDSGLIITNSDTNFKSQQDETGTYYYDGTNVIGQYTKDGSKQKDLQLFGVYYYGMDDINDTPMFVTQLYTENGEECVGHFYNGGDY